METTTLISEPKPVEPKAVRAVVIRTRNLVVASCLVGLLAIGAGTTSGIVSAQVFDTPGAQGEMGPMGLPGADGVDGERGPRGRKGRTGKTGKNGLNGANGAAGATIVRDRACSNDIDVPLPYC